ncbi:hypothetical protein [Citrobacter phage CVT22]|uniref:Uncharacterized protein n=1 Tax=Citrobacter phage CVT22 TaxID=1622234 RepID=A0A0R6CJ26_9CAUD|nr:hypothetical protein APL39_gp70 [Citrobacter phage CVT22]AJT60773.2 hypothetical protein [Citrobacter phage CVT22]
MRVSHVGCSLIITRLKSIRIGTVLLIGVFIRLLIMARLTVDQAIAIAPYWATHMSVNKRTGFVEYFNTVDGKGSSAGILGNLTLNTRHYFGADGFLRRLVDGETEWKLVEINVQLENE